MRLNRIEILGFKSFADRVVLEFDHDINAVVGPNGSGKSNISDAIRWVLGEQSAKSLRGEKMEDVIFSGTDQRAPLNYAKVSLSFDNGDGRMPLPYKTVVVTRRVYRSGESEYLINNSRVRLKDVKELFLDTGVGKEGYSVIGQGKIDEILNSKGEDRRLLFEEASGIAKYKYRKQESEKKLERVVENLAEIEGLWKEQKTRTEFLEEQANRARRGLKLSQELEVHEFSLLKKSLGVVEAELARLEEKEEALTAEWQESRQESERLEAKTAPIREKREAAKSQKQDTEKSAMATQRTLYGLEAEKTVGDEREKYLRREEERLLETIAADEKKRGENDRKREEFLEKQRRLLREQEYAVADAKRAKDELERESECVEEEEAALKELGVEKERLDEEYRERAMLRETRIQVGKSRRAEREQKQALREESIRALAVSEEKEASFRRLLEEARVKGRESEEEIAALERTLAQREEGLRRRKESVSDLVSAHREAQSSRKILRSVYENYEGYYRPVQQLLRAAKGKKELQERMVGTLADLIVVEGEYRTAVDVALGAALQNIVTRNEEDAKVLIEFLKRNKIGRVTFLPMTAIRAKRPIALSKGAALAMAYEVVQCPREIRHILDYFLGNTAIVEDMDAAIALAAKRISGLRIVTLEGEIINSWGSMIGGDLGAKSSGSLINRKQVLQGLTAKITELEGRLKKEKKEIREAEALIEEEKARLGEAQSRRMSIHREIEDADARHRESATEKALRESALKHLEEELSVEPKEEIFDEDEYLRRKNLREKKSEEYRKAVEELEDRRQQLREKEKSVWVLENRLETLERDRNILGNTLNAIEADEEETKRSMTNQRNFLEENRKELAQIRENKRKMEAEEAVLRERQSKEAEAVEALEKRIEELDAQLSADESKRQYLVEEVHSLEKEIYACGIKKENAVSRRESAIASILDEYDLEQEELETKLRSLNPVETTRAAVKKIRDELREIGYFKRESIDEYVKEKQALEDLQTQVQDLEASRADVVQVIAELEKKMRDMFEKSFHVIKEKFDEIFQKLFDGGTASLILDDEDSLNAGIEIVAQPPGKKLQNMGLLSGGERALTAVALLFAIFETRPAPFCVLDEIDASLDETNISRYISYLKSFAGQVQFIVITHRKTTMEMADVLYGVTMQERGVSTVLTMDLSKVS